MRITFKYLSVIVAIALDILFCDWACCQSNADDGWNRTTESVLQRLTTALQNADLSLLSSISNSEFMKTDGFVLLSQLAKTQSNLELSSGERYYYHQYKLKQRNVVFTQKFKLINGRWYIDKVIGLPSTRSGFDSYEHDAGMLSYLNMLRAWPGLSDPSVYSYFALDNEGAITLNNIDKFFSIESNATEGIFEIENINTINKMGTYRLTLKEQFPGTNSLTDNRSGWLISGFENINSITINGIQQQKRYYENKLAKLETKVEELEKKREETEKSLLLREKSRNKVDITPSFRTMSSIDNSEDNIDIIQQVDIIECLTTDTPYVRINLRFKKELNNIALFVDSLGLMLNINGSPLVGKSYIFSYSGDSRIVTFDGCWFQIKPSYKSFTDTLRVRQHKENGDVNRVIFDVLK